MLNGILLCLDLLCAVFLSAQHVALFVFDESLRVLVGLEQKLLPHLPVALYLLGNLHLPLALDVDAEAVPLAEVLQQRGVLRLVAVPPQFVVGELRQRRPEGARLAHPEEGLEPVGEVHAEKAPAACVHNCLNYTESPLLLLRFVGAFHKLLPVVQACPVVDGL